MLLWLLVAYGRCEERVGAGSWTVSGVIRQTAVWVVRRRSARQVRIVPCVRIVAGHGVPRGQSACRRSPATVGRSCQLMGEITSRARRCSGRGGVGSRSFLCTPVSDSGVTIGTIFQGSVGICRGNASPPLGADSTAPGVAPPRFATWRRRVLRVAKSKVHSSFHSPARLDSDCDYGPTHGPSEPRRHPCSQHESLARVVAAPLLFRPAAARLAAPNDAPPPRLGLVSPRALSLPQRVQTITWLCRLRRRRRRGRR